MNYSVDEAKSDLDKIPETTILYERMIQVSSIITKLMYEHVKESDLPIIVGGLSLEIYTESEYTTHDIDFVTSAAGVMKEKLLEIGFENKERIFQHKRLNVAVDIVDSALDPPDYDGISKVELKWQIYLC